MFNFSFHCFLLLLKQFFSLRISSCSLHTPVHKLLNILDLHASLFQTFNDPERFNLRVTEFKEGGTSNAVRTKIHYAQIGEYIFKWMQRQEVTLW